MEMYTIYDNLAEKALNPIFFENEKIAIRNFSMIVNNSKNESIHENPQDFDLYKLGEFDEKGIYIKEDRKKIINGKAVKNGKE